ncbi:MAG: CPBP family intramembrane metalloprotease [Firmicutes bacterium]|nr:CPBP family intramembrane metalloprotease [Bacillota bacterium]
MGLIGKKLIKSTYLTFALLIIVWIGAWLLKLDAEEYLLWLKSSGGSFVYWLIAKILIWIIPAMFLLKISKRDLNVVFNLSNWRSWLGWGGGIGLLIALTGIIPNYVQNKPILPTSFSWPLINVLVIAPIFEEFLFRGAILGNLQKKYSPFIANLISSAMFLLLHIPGWYFMGVLTDNLTRPAGGALSIFLVSIAFGLATQRSKSVMGGIIAHFLNNLF